MGENMIYNIYEKDISNAISKLCMQGAYTLSDDVLDAYLDSYISAEDPREKYIMGELIRNSQISNEGKFPLCQDTGIAIVFVEIGLDIHINGDLHKAINQGVRDAYADGFLRKSVLDNPLFDRKNTGDNTPANVNIEFSNSIPSNEIRISLIQKGGGCANCSNFKAIVPSEGIEGVKDFVVETIKNAGGKPCPPIVVNVGIDSDNAHSALNAQKASLRHIGERNEDPKVAELELELLEEINKLNIGAQGFGGKATAFDVHIKQGTSHLVNLLTTVDITCNIVRHRSVIIKLSAGNQKTFYFENNFNKSIPVFQENNQNIKEVKLPLTKRAIKNLNVGDVVSLSGEIYTARDAAHKRLLEMIEKKEKLPFNLKNATIYYVGPTPTRPDEIIGSCGPTTSIRMDAYSKVLFENGVKGMIGKGQREKETMNLMKKHECVYFAAIGGAAAVAAESVVSNEPVTFEDLGPEAIRKLEVKDWICTVAVDSKGNSIFERE